MKLPPLKAGTLIRRYKRFLADIELESGTMITAACPNTGSMQTCSDPGSSVRLSVSDNPKRKYAHTWELVFTNNGWVGINTHMPNKLVAEAIADGTIPELSGYEQVKREVRYGKNSRIDLLLSNHDSRCYVEIKNVTLVEHETAFFPDAVTTRGTKHLNELMSMVDEGHRAVMFYLIQRMDGHIFKPAAHIDPLYTDTLKAAVSRGVEILAYEALVTEEQITVSRRMPVAVE